MEHLVADYFQPYIGVHFFQPTSGPDTGVYVPGVVQRSIGDSQAYLKIALEEVIRAKQNENSLVSHRPNLVAANLSLSLDAQFALNRAYDLKLSNPEVELSPNLDALAVATVGIDERLERSRFSVLHQQSAQVLPCWIG